MALTLGIDIGKTSIRGAVLRTGLRSQEIERYLEVPVSALDATGNHDHVVRAAVHELIAQLPVPPDQVIASLDGARASLRVVQIPAVAKKRAADVLPFELDPLLPFPIEDAMVDFQEVRQAGEKLDLLAAAVPETVVAETLESLGQAGLQPRELAVGAAALDGLAPFLNQPPGEAWMLVHVDAERIDIAVLRDGACELARTLDEGVEALRPRPDAVRLALAQTLMKYRGDGGPLPARVLVMGLGSNDANFLAWVG